MNELNDRDLEDVAAAKGPRRVDIHVPPIRLPAVQPATPIPLPGTPRELHELELERVSAGADAKGITCGTARAVAAICDGAGLSDGSRVPVRRR